MRQTEGWVQRLTLAQYFSNEQLRKTTSNRQEADDYSSRKLFHANNVIRHHSILAYQLPAGHILNIRV